MYNRFENGIHPRDQVSDILAAAKDHSSSLEDHVRLLEKVSKVRKGAKIRNRYNQVLHLTLDTNGKVTNSQ